MWGSMTEINLTQRNVRWRRRSLAAYSAAVFLVAFSYFLFQREMVQAFKVVLQNYEQLVIGFAILSFALVPFRLRGGNTTINAGAQTKFGLLIPIINLLLDPLLDISLFYAALFILDAIVENGINLSLDSSLVLLVVSSVLLFQSIKDLYDISRTVFTAERR